VKVQSEGKIALATASSGISATLLDGGTTAHSRFKIPIDIQSELTCNILAQRNLANLLRETDLMFWDEISMQNRYAFETVDHMLKDLHSDS